MDTEHSPERFTDTLGLDAFCSSLWAAASIKISVSATWALETTAGICVFKARPICVSEGTTGHRVKKSGSGSGVPGFESKLYRSPRLSSPGLPWENAWEPSRVSLLQREAIIIILQQKGNSAKRKQKSTLTASHDHWFLLYFALSSWLADGNNSVYTRLLRRVYLLQRKHASHKHHAQCLQPVNLL